MHIDILIKGGRVIDPARDLDAVCDVAIGSGTIIPIPSNEGFSARCEIDANDMLVLPGLIDFHTHIFCAGTDYGVSPLLLPATGVTTVVDGGSAGTANYESFHGFAAGLQEVRVKALLNVSPTGISSLKHHENVDPSVWDRVAIVTFIEKYGSEIIGLKVRQSKDIVKELGLKPLLETIKIAEETGIRVVVHITDPPCRINDIVSVLRCGDVLCHVFQGYGHTIVEDGRLNPAVIEAKKRGVIFDASNGMSHFDFYVAETALREGFTPDIIASDITRFTFLQTHAVALPYLMTKYLYMGMALQDIVKSVTSKPAELLDMRQKIGTLAIGAAADVTILKLKESQVRFEDAKGNLRKWDKMLVPQMTIKDGRILFKQMDFCPGY